MRRWRRTTIKRLVCLAGFFLGSATWAGEEPADAARLLADVSNHHNEGEFEAAWNSYRAFLAHPDKNHLDVALYMFFFNSNGAPSLGTLGAFLGKKESEAGDYRSFCPDLVAKSSCSEWVEQQTYRFDADPVRNTPPAQQTVPLTYIRDLQRPRPGAEIGVAGKRDLALVDTGSSSTDLYYSFLTGGSGLAEFLGRQSVLTVHGHIEKSVVRLKSISLGTADFKRILGWLSDGEGHNAIGMDLLLRYGAVCFDWHGQKLHLGELGPCVSGSGSNEASLDGTLTIELAVRTEAGRHSALIDTGMDLSYCSPGFVEQHNGGRIAFSFGEHPELTGECVYDENQKPLFEPTRILVEGEQVASLDPFDLVIGMDTLLQFDAFGWRLRPMRMYFVPKSTDSETASHAISPDHR